MADADIAETWKQAEKLLDKGKTEGALELLRKADPDGKEATTLRIAGKANPVIGFCRRVCLTLFFYGQSA